MLTALRTAFAALALAAAAHAHAITFNLPLDGFDIKTGSFADQIAFAMPAANSGLAVNVTSANIGGYLIAGLMFSITGPGGFSLADMAPGVPAVPSATILTGTHFGSLAAGPGYLLTIAGKAQGAQGGFYSFSVEALPIPEPGTWMLIAAGLLLVSVIARQRVRG